MSKISPLAIARRTPMSNCGQCGHLTCLAFGAAVVKTGIPLTICPFIDVTGLDYDPAVAAPRMDQEAKELEFIASLKEKITPFDLARLAPGLGATSPPTHPDSLFFRYLGQEVSLSKSTLLIDQRLPDDPRDQILLYNYVASQGGQAPTANWIGMESLPNSISKIKTLATYCETRLATLFAERPAEQIMAALQAVDGTTALNPSANLAATVPVLPKVPQCILFWEAAPEDNFPARVKVLFDRQVLTFLDLESLVFSAERLAERLTALLNR